MKFTKLALASAAAFGLAGVALADDPEVAFAGVADGLDSWQNLNVAPMTGYSDEGTLSDSGVGAVWFGGSDADDTKVMEWAAEGAPATYSGTHPGGMQAGANYLKVSNSNPLWRMLNAYSKTGEDWPTEFPDEQGQAVGDGLFVDTLVQFTPSEDAPSVEEGSKLIVWMNAESNLCVTASKIITEGDDEGTIVAANFVTAKKLQVNTWYRLTVKAYDTILSDGSTRNVHGFKVLIDGRYVSSEDAVAGDAEFAWFPLSKDEMADELAAGEVFFSLSDDETATLAAVGFKGEGLVDDIVVTDVDPFPSGAPTGIDFTLTWDANVSAVWYAIDDVESEATKGEEINLADGSTFAITRATPAAWYTIDPASTNAAPVDGGTYTVTASAASSGEAAGVTGDLSGFSVSEIQAAFPNKTPAEINSATDAYLDYQFGQELNTLSAEPTVEITDIKPVEGGWTIKVQVKNGENALNLNDGSDSTMRATLKVKSAATLADFADASKVTTAAYDITFDGTTTDVITVPTSTNTDPFFKAYVDFATPANVE